MVGPGTFDYMSGTSYMFVQTYIAHTLSDNKYVIFIVYSMVVALSIFVV